jgi:hypothetical protein
VSGNNTGDGFSGSHSTLAECSSYENDAHGYRIGLASIARGCGARLNTGSGFFLQRASQLVECSSYGDARTGIEAADFTTIRACTIDLSNGLGITAATGTVIEQCTISACENGIDQLEGSTDMIVRGCRVTSNVGWGIRARDRSLIEGNHVTDNGVTSPAYFDGILIMGQDNVIRQNVMIGNDRAKMDLGVDNLWVDNIEQNNVALP